MSKHFCVQIRLLPILNNQLIAVSHGITGIIGTTLVLIGYYDLIKKRSKQEK
jgi:hypothetical protein